MQMERQDREQYRQGKAANMGGKPRDPNRSIDWLLGWDEAEADRALDDYEGW